MQTAKLLVEVDKTGGEADDAAIMFKRKFRVLDRVHQRMANVAKTLVACAFGREHKEFLLGVFNLFFRRHIHHVLERGVDHFFADADQHALEREVVDGFAVIGDVDNGDRCRGELGQIRAAANVGERCVLVKKVFKRNRVCYQPLVVEIADGLKNTLMQRFIKMLGLEAIADVLQRLIVDQKRAKQRLLRLDIARG